MKYFTPPEFACSHCGLSEMSTKFTHALDELRGRCGFPFVITSGYRCPYHPKEVIKPTPGTHNKGIAGDVLCTSSFERYVILKEAMLMGVFTGIGIGPDFIHLDIRKTTPVTWVYS